MFIHVFVLFFLLFDPDLMILFGDKSLLLTFCVLLKIFVFSKKFYDSVCFCFNVFCLFKNVFCVQFV